jgi:hypothetical protein
MTSRLPPHTNENDIGNEMAQAEYLHKYCNFILGKKIAKNTLRRMKKEKGKHFILPRNEWLKLINDCVLSTTKSKMFPDKWPWLYNVTPKQYKLQNDATRQIFILSRHGMS